MDIILGENTAASVSDLALLELDLIRVKGKSEAARIHALVGDETVRESASFQALSRVHGEMLEAYRSRRWQSARQALETWRTLAAGFNLESFYDLMADRLKEFEAIPPDRDWDGVCVATSK